MNLYLSAFRKPFLVRLGIFHPPRLKSESFARCRQWWQKPFTFSGRVSRFDEDLWLLRWFGWWPFHRLGSIISWHDGFIWKKKKKFMPAWDEWIFFWSLLLLLFTQQWEQDTNQESLNDLVRNHAWNINWNEYFACGTKPEIRYLTASLKAVTF